MGLLFFFQGVAAETNAAAGLAAGTGAAANAAPTTAKIASAELASGTGAAAFGIGGVLILASTVAAGGSTGLDAEADTSTAVFASTATGTGAALNAAGSLKPNAAAALGTETTVNVVTDTFTRTASSGLGTADSGQVWTIAGTASAFNVASGVATFDHTASNQSRRAWLAAVVLHDVDQTFRWKAPATSGSDHHIFIRLRQTVSADGDAIMPKLVISGSTMTLSIVRRAVSIETELASQLLTISFEADTFYTFRARLLGQGLFAKVWKSSDSEPVNWQIAATDTQLGESGGVGMATYSPAGATYPFSFTWDDLDTDEIRGSQAYSPTITSNSAVNVAAIAALGTGAAANTGASLSAPISAASGTGAGYDMTVDMLLSEGVGSGSGTGAAFAPSDTFQVFAESASAIGEAWGQTADIILRVDLAEGGGDAFNTVAYSVAASEVALGVGAAFDTAVAQVSTVAGYGIIGFRTAGGVMTVGRR